MSSKIAKITLYVLGIVVLLLFTLLAVVRTSWFQNIAVQKAAMWLSDELKTKVTVGGFDLALPDAFVLKELVVFDRHNDTMISVGRLKARIASINRKEAVFRFRSAVLTQPVFHLIRRDDGFNYNFLIDYFTPAVPNPNAPDNVLIISSLILENGNFRFRDHTYDAPDYGPFKENDIYIKNIHAELKSFTLIADSLNFRIDALQAREQSGIAIRNMKSEVVISKKLMEFSRLFLQTEESVLKEYVAFRYEHYNQLGYFIDSVAIEGNLSQSSISLKDLSAFAWELKPYDDVIYAHGKVFGKVSNLRSPFLNLESSRLGSFKGKMRLKGLPDWQTTYASLYCEPLILKFEQLEFLAGKDQIPGMFSQLGELKYTGDFQGFYNDFVSMGTLNTALGQLQTNVNLKMKENEIPSYSGQIASSGFDFGRLYLVDELGKASFDMRLKGKGFELNEFKVDVEGKIHNLDYHNYSYQNIQMSGKLENKFFLGKMEVNDPNAQFKFGGTIDLAAAIPVYEFEADIKQAKLRQLGWDSEESSFTGKLSVQINGSEVDNLFGIARFQELEIYRNSKHYTFDDIVLISEIAGYERDVFLYSEFADGHLSGDFRLSRFNEIWKELRASLLPDYYSMPEEMDLAFDLKASATLNNAEKFADLLQWPLRMNNGEITGSYTSEGKELKLSLNMQDLGYENLTLKDLRLMLSRNQNQPLYFEEYSAQIFLGNRLFSQKSIIAGSLGGNRSDFNVTLVDSLSKFYLNLSATTQFLSDSIVLQIREGTIQLDTTTWSVNEQNALVWNQGSAEISGFELKSSDQLLQLQASITKDKQESDVLLRNFDLSIVNSFLADTSNYFAGRASGLLSTENTYNQPVIYADLIIENFQYVSDTLGDVRLVSKTINPQRPYEMNVTASVQDGLLKDVALYGTIDVSPGVNKVDMQLDWNDGRIKPLERFTGGIASGIDGRIKAKATVKGDLQSPKINGTAKLNGATFIIDYLGVRYTFDHELSFTERELRFNQVKIRDELGRNALVSGIMRHKYLNDISYDIRIEDAVNLMVLNTQKGDNELFYGKAFADGSCRITGDLYDVDFKIKVKSRAGSQLFIPLDYEEENVTAGFIKFTSFNMEVPVSIEEKTREGSYTMDFNLELTPDAELWLIFDEQLGDIIKGKGAGNLKMEMNSDGAFNMYGTYVISAGSYQYTALNFFSKEFAIDQGSQLVWDGDPYQARMDLTATKREFAAPYDLTAAYTNDQALLEQMRNKIPVDCKLELNGLLFNPEIKFNFEIGDLGTSQSNAATAQFNTILQQIKTDPDEVNRQVFSLLVLGTFLPPTFGQGIGNTSAIAGVQNTYRNSVSDLISNQLSNWFSQLDPKWQVGVNWQAAGEEVARELVVSVRRRFLNERLEFAGSVDAGSSYNYTPYNLNIRYNISTDGRFMVHGFTRQVNDPTLGNITNITTTGVGLYYRKEFEQFFKPKNKVKKAEP